VTFFYSQHSDATLLRKDESRIAKGKDKRKDSYRKTALTVVKGRGNKPFLTFKGQRKAGLPLSVGQRLAGLSDQEIH